MKKRICVLFLILIMLISITGCGTNNSANEKEYFVGTWYDTSWLNEEGMPYEELIINDNGELFWLEDGPYSYDVSNDKFIIVNPYSDNETVYTFDIITKDGMVCLQDKVGCVYVNDLDTAIELCKEAMGISSESYEAETTISGVWIGYYSDETGMRRTVKLEFLSDGTLLESSWPNESSSYRDYTYKILDGDRMSVVEYEGFDRERISDILRVSPSQENTEVFVDNMNKLLEYEGYSTINSLTTTSQFIRFDIDLYNFSGVKLELTEIDMN